MASRSRFVNKRQILNRISKVAPAIIEDVVEALRTNGTNITNMQRRLAPKKSGKLARSIKWQFGDRKRIAYSQGGGGAAGAQGRLSIRISAGDTTVRYAHLVEFGAAPHIAGGIFKGSQHPGAPAQPFFYPAYRALKRPSVARIRRAMRRGAKKAWQAK